MTLKKALAELKKLSDDAVLKRNAKNGAGEQFGVPLGEIRKVAKAIKKDHELGLELWKTGIADAQLLGTLLMNPKKLSSEELDDLVRTISFSQVADWLNAYIVKKHPERESMREEWLTDDDPWAARAGWSLTWNRIPKESEGLDLGGLLDRLDSELGNAPPEAQWTMNFALIEIGVHHKKHRKRAIQVGKTHGLYQDYPVSKGCVTPFAPVAIEELARRLEG